MMESKYHLEMARECLAAAELATPEGRKVLLEMAKLYTLSGFDQSGITASSPDRTKAA